MQIKCSMKWALAGLFLVLLANTTEADEKGDEILSEISMDLPPKPKRPFCNAFTGCGKKRNYDENSLDRLSQSPVKIDLPPHLYKAFIRALSDELRSAMARRLTDEGNSEISFQDYLSFLALRKPLRTQIQS